MKILSSLNELVVFIKVQLDSHSGELKEKYESTFYSNIQILMTKYTDVKNIDFNSDSLVNDLYTRIKLFITNHSKL